ncbi:MAG: hypothetical protein JRN06_05055 [Nitrososphaerota archaeon]|nr:hypothetical protein [Nitrososphaerota archaeon]
MKKFLAALLVGVVFFTLPFSVQTLKADSNPVAGNQIANPLSTDKIIVANFLNLSQIGSITPFRSCAGHDYFSVDYNGSSEPLSSMKMYATPIGSLQNTSDKVQVFAPFNGTVTYIDPTDTYRGMHYVIRHEPFDGWYVTFFHQNFNDSKIYVGAHVTAGELLSYAVIPGPGYNFDINLQRFSNESAQYNGVVNGYNSQIVLLENQEPLLPHMTDSVLAQWVAHGVTVNNSIIGISYREANPCVCFGEAPGTTGCNFDYAYNPDEGVLLNRG